MKTALIFTQNKAKMKREKEIKSTTQILLFSKLYLQHRHACIIVFVANISQSYVQCLTTSYWCWDSFIWEKTMGKGGWT